MSFILYYQIIIIDFFCVFIKWKSMQNLAIKKNKTKQKTTTESRCYSSLSYAIECQKKKKIGRTKFHKKICSDCFL